MGFDLVEALGAKLAADVVKTGAGAGAGEGEGALERRWIRHCRHIEAQPPKT